MIRAATRWTVVRPFLALAWLMAAAGFLHLFANATRPSGLDLRGGIALAGALSLALAGLTVAGRGRWIRLASNASALGLFVFASLLVATRLAHETGIALLAGFALVLAFGVVASGADGDDSGPSAGERP